MAKFESHRLQTPARIPIDGYQLLRLDCATEGEYTRRPARRGILARTRSTLPCTDGAISDSGRLILANPAFRRIWEIERNAVDVALEEYNVLEDE